jgi:hypothetical protein
MLVTSNNKSVNDTSRQTTSFTDRQINNFNSYKMNNKNNINISKNKKSSIVFRHYKKDKEIYHHINGKVAKSLIFLIVSGNSGITALEVSSWAFRLAAYIHILRTKYDIDIITIDEPHDGGIHGRYILKDRVDIIHKKIKK